MTLPVTALTAAILAIMILATAISTVRERFKAGVPFGDGEVDTLTKASRAHGNLVEHAPLGVIMIGLLEMVPANHWILTGIAALFLASRAAHIVGIYNQSDPAKPPLGRSLGVIGTWLSYALLILWIFWKLISVEFGI
ncbi:MAPEG family protein [Alterisphingorhabdus coralli]|uniref:MAPEG family protein n=1 Tax=Alterisphingorhabdus coralli TaxID=3071408 RepID=A0AA97F6T2_9SPHN|nr:MAPEG family protein [Parasphingorhabdus sp. SCSIO 66989]WOE75013.1 MAPEG family protein [Parasphingorhabdus sp. SCSIO 66989]